MRKLLALLLTLCFALTAACAETAAPAQPQPDGAQSDVLVACFSATGNTRAVAETLAELLGADLYEIVPAEPYTEEDLDYGNSQSRTSLEMDDPDARPAIAGELPDLTGYTTLYLGYPIWHGEAPRILATFVEACDLTGKTVIPFATSGGSGVEGAARNLAKAYPQARWKGGKLLNGSGAAAWAKSALEDRTPSA